MARAFVVKLGGSFLMADGKANVKDFQEMASVVKHYARQGNRFVVVVGGGMTARNYISAAEALGSNNGVKDYFGILVSRLNARLFIEAVNDPELACADPPESLPELRKSLQQKSIVAIGGLQPGQSTTAVSALCGEFVNASRVVFCTDVDGVFTADPRKNPDAKLLPSVSYRRLEELTGTENSAPGQYRLMDGVALTILERSRLNALIIRGTAENLRQALEGGRIGTAIEPEPHKL